jgi:hypothetical protein
MISFGVNEMRNRTLLQEIDALQKQHAEESTKASLNAVPAARWPNRMNGIWIDQEMWDRRIYRIFDHDRFLAILREQRMGLMPVGGWQDPFENFLLKCDVQLKDGRRASLQTVQKSWFGQCWTLHAESDAMWRIYSDKQQGVRVSTTIGQLFDAVYDRNDEFAQLNYYIGKVQYWARADIEDLLNSTSFLDITSGGQTVQFAGLLCVKRPEFEHENEVRVIVHDQTSPSVRQVNLEPLSLFDDLVLDPRLDDTALQSRVQDLQNAGWSKSIRQSELYRVQSRTIPVS